MFLSHCRKYSVPLTKRNMLWGGLFVSAPIGMSKLQVSAVQSRMHQFSSVQLLSRVWLSATHGLQYTRLPCPSPTPGVCSNSCPLSWWCHPTIPSSVIPFSSCPWPFPASESFQMSQVLASGGQSIGVSTSASVLPMNIQDWISLGLTGLISMQSMVLSTVFSNTTFQKHQFFGAQLSL